MRRGQTGRLASAEGFAKPAEQAAAGSVVCRADLGHVAGTAGVSLTYEVRGVVVPPGGSSAHVAVRRRAGPAGWEPPPRRAHAGCPARWSAGGASRDRAA